MSYDVQLLADLGGPEPVPLGDCWNYTSNCAPMWRAAGIDLARFHGKTAGECLPVLEAGIRALRADPPRFRAMNPPNGWGSYAGLVERLEVLATHFRAAPQAVVEVSH